MKVQVFKYKFPLNPISSSWSNYIFLITNTQCTKYIRKE